MRNWDAPEEMNFLGQAVAVLQDGGVLAPDSFGLPSPLDMQGLEFPTVSQCKVSDVPTLVVNRITGRQEFNNATLRDIDFTKARLNFSVWNNCVFEKVCFDRTALNQVRFFGCHFVNCTFRSADLRDASFSVGPNGADTEITSTIFDKTDFRGASCNNSVFHSTSFVSCKLDGFVFDGALCDGVKFIGKFKELTFRGGPNDSERNQLRIDLSASIIMWLNVDYGLDLHEVVLPSDGSCLIIKSRLRAIESLCSRLPKEAGKCGSLVANVLKGLFSDRAVSALEPSQDMILISKAMIADFAETDDMSIVDSIFNRVRTITQSEGCFVTNDGD